MNGEFESMKALHATLPEMVPRPIAWGTYESDSEIHFFLSDFHELDDQLCSLDTFPKLIAEVHSRRISPNGKFGFPVTTYQGRLPQDPTPCDTWEECFTRNIDIMFEHELAAQGHDEEFAKLRETLRAKVVPRLLRPMETAGRTVVPRLVHGDLWEGNAGTDLDTGVPKIFDACSLYAHNECKLDLPSQKVAVPLVRQRKLTRPHGKTKWPPGDQCDRRWANHTSRPTSNTSLSRSRQKTLTGATCFTLCMRFSSSCSNRMCFANPAHPWSQEVQHLLLGTLPWQRELQKSVGGCASLLSFPGLDRALTPGIAQGSSRDARTH